MKGKLRVSSACWFQQSDSYRFIFLVVFFLSIVLAVVPQLPKQTNKQTNAMKPTRFKTYSLRERLNETYVLKMLCNQFLAQGLLNLTWSYITGGSCYQLCAILFVFTAFASSDSISMLVNCDHQAGDVFIKVLVPLNVRISIGIYFLNHCSSDENGQCSISLKLKVCFKRW